ncbi:nucleotidyltransferase family protein [Catalinimonas sp. 4WD22]|uniref:nucleotidyltransferase family protein n=1 Tax=Catalinimonas locisalis TaxID=3133978 RepID=UPI003101107D
MKPSKTEILHILSQQKSILAQKYHVDKLGLFGSYAREEATENSDIDILVDFTKPIGMEIVDLTMELEKALHYPIDIVTINAVRQRLFDYIKQDLVYV